MTKNALIVSEPTTDPVIEKRRSILNRLELAASRFKRIDIRFLQIVKAGQSLPAFAILPYHEYKIGQPCNWNGYLNGYDCGFAELFTNKPNLDSFAQSVPPGLIPESVEILHEEVNGHFDQIMIAWEADWQVAGDDPLMIGEIDSVWFLLAQWDATKLESFIASEPEAG